MPTAPTPRQIGPYHILEELGRGGMGVVYRAEQKEPVRRYVALKVVQSGRGTKEVLARFQLERRALAAMSHRCIAKVFDAGATEQGEPYFVMEIVEGLPLTTYCDRHKLSLTDRIKLFQQVCDGVQHAHLKGIVHRDLKPSNVLVVREGDAAVPKILDFGLAKPTNRGLVDITVFTEADRILGTGTLASEVLAFLVDLHAKPKERSILSCIPGPEHNHYQRWDDKPDRWRAACLESPGRVASSKGKELQRRRSEFVERTFDHLSETGRGRRSRIRGMVEVSKRYLMQVATHNLGRILRTLFGVETHTTCGNAARAPHHLAFGFWVFMGGLGCPLSRCVDESPTLGHN